jgi:hypothetical protein
MIDPFVLLTPVLLYAVVSLLRFVGCAAILKLDDVQYAPANNPMPTIDVNGLQPKSKTVCEGPFTLEISGSGFVPNVTELFWDSQKRTVKVTSNTKLTVDIAAEDIEELAPGQLARNVQVGVSNPTPGGGTAFATFTILPGVTKIVRLSSTAKTGDPIGDVGGLEFEQNQWVWSDLGSTGGDFDAVLAPGSRSGQFSFKDGKGILKEMEIHAVKADPQSQETITLTPDNKPAFQQTVSTSNIENKSILVALNQNQCAKTITVAFSAADILRIHSITYMELPK